MPGDKKHHTDKMRRCVEQVKGKGHDESSAYAICTTSMQNAGESVYENAQDHDDVTVLASSEPRGLHLLGATGPVRYETLNDRRHLVVPIIALMEGVIHPVNASTPEYVSEETLRKAASSWIGKPVCLGHPAKGGKQCSATDPEVRKAAGIGVIMRSEMKGKKLAQEAWIDEEKAKRLHPVMYETLAKGGREEVSVGAFVITSVGDGNYGDKAYKATWLETQGDHLAFLPGGKGACSCAMGCGTHRAAMHFVAAESIELVPDDLPLLVFSVLQDESLDERIQKVNNAVYQKWPYPKGEQVAMPSTAAYPMQVFDDRVIVRKGDETYSCSYTIKDGEVILGEATPVKQKWVAAKAKYTDCEMCHGTGQMKSDGKQADCPTCHGEGKLKAAAGARHSSSDTKMIQMIHDQAMALGATCDRGNYEAAAAITPQPKDADSKIHIKRVGLKWELVGSGGRVLAMHDTEIEAQAQADAIKSKICA